MFLLIWFWMMQINILLVVLACAFLLTADKNYFLQLLHEYTETPQRDYIELVALLEENEESIKE